MLLKCQRPFWVLPPKHRRHVQGKVAQTKIAGPGHRIRTKVSVAPGGEENKRVGEWDAHGGLAVSGQDLQQMAGKMKAREGGKEKQTVATPHLWPNRLASFSGFFRKQSDSLEANTVRGACLL